MSDTCTAPATNERKRVLILLNATAGTGRAGTNAWDIVSAFASEGYEPVVYPIVPGTELGSEHLLAQYEGKVDMVFCGGGDGTLNPNSNYAFSWTLVRRADGSWWHVDHGY